MEAPTPDSPHLCSLRGLDEEMEMSIFFYLLALAAPADNCAGTDGWEIQSCQPGEDAWSW